MTQRVEAIRSEILNWLEKRVDSAGLAWLKKTGETLKGSPEDWELYTSFSAVPSHTGKGEAIFVAGELNKAEKLRNGWNPAGWGMDQLGRTYLMLCFAEQGEEEFLDKIEKTFVTSDLGEAVALYKALPLFPYPERFRKRAAEGVRSNITTVFEAVALENPYPKEYLDEDAFNQIVLKALFVGSPLYRIRGIDERANQTLAKMFVEYAHERWSAGRTVSPELWRPVGPFIDQKYESDIRKVLEHPAQIQKRAATLAVISSDYPGKEKLVKQYQTLMEEVAGQEVTWDAVGREFEESDN